MGGSEERTGGRENNICSQKSTIIYIPSFGRGFFIFLIIRGGFELNDYLSSFEIPQSCLSRSFKAEVYSCPSCRHQLGKEYVISINKDLQTVLLDLFPGYTGGR